MKKLPWILILISAFLFICSIFTFVYSKTDFFQKKNTVKYSCSNGKEMEVFYYENMVRILLDDNEYILYQGISASGLKYENKYGYTFFSKADKVAFNGIANGIEWN